VPTALLPGDTTRARAAAQLGLVPCPRTDRQRTKATLSVYDSARAAISSDARRPAHRRLRHFWGRRRLLVRPRRPRPPAWSSSGPATGTCRTPGSSTSRAPRPWSTAGSLHPT